MSIQQGDPIPPAKVFELDDQGAARAMPAAERFAGKRIVLFAVPARSFETTTSSSTERTTSRRGTWRTTPAYCWASRTSMAPFSASRGRPRCFSHKLAGHVTAASIQTRHRQGWCRPVLKAVCWGFYRGSSV
jgi:hypothetical protein